MRLLIISQYFPPEIGAPQNRLYEWAIRLQQKGVKVTILTAMPNYPEGKVHAAYRGKCYCYEEKNNLAIHRTYIYAVKSKRIIPRLLNYFSFVLSSFLFSYKLENRYDVVFCESPPLFLGISAYAIAWCKKARFVFNVSDLWPESAEKLGIIHNRFLLFIAYWLESYLYHRAHLITGQTQGIVNNIHQRFPGRQVHWLPNGADLSFFNPGEFSADMRKELGFLPDDFILSYAGIIGHAQGLEVILKAAEKLQYNEKIKFILLGEGPVKKDLLKWKQEKGLHNVYFLDPIPKNKMPVFIAAIDVAIIPLKKLELFKGAIPSKIFENLAMRKPVLLGVEGEAKELFIDRAQAGLFFTPEDADDLCQKIIYLWENKDKLPQMGERGRLFVQQHFNRDDIAEKFYHVLKQITAT